MKKLLVLNGSHSEIPLIKAGKDLGLHVITTGSAPSLIGHHYADDYVCADYSDKDEILTLAKKRGIDYICSCANDFGAITAAYVAEKIGLPGHDSYSVALSIHHKDRFKRLAKDIALRTPRAESFESKDTAYLAVANFDLPIIIKPIDLTGGKGITKVESWEAYQAAVDIAFDYSRVNRIIVEEYFSGTQHSFSTFIVDRKVVFSFSDNEYSYLNPYLVTSSAAPASNIDQFSLPLVSETEKVAEALGLVDGILHSQYLANDNDFTIIEMTRRCSGDLYPYPVQYSSGIDWGRWIVEAESGLERTPYQNARQSGFCGRHCIMGEKNGTLKSISICKEVEKYIYDQSLWWKPGDVVSDYLTHKHGILFLKYDTEEEMLSVTKRLNSLIHVDVES